MMNTMCRWLCTMYYLPCSPINLNSESPEAWLKIGYVKVLLYLPPGTELAGYIVILHGSSSECSLRKVTRKIINNAFYIMHSASLCAWIFHTLCKEEVLFSKWIWLAGKDCYGELRLSHKEKKKKKRQLVYVVLNQLFFRASLVFLSKEWQFVTLLISCIFVGNRHDMFIFLKFMPLYLKTERRNRKGGLKRDPCLAFTFQNMQIMLSYSKASRWKIESGCVCDFKEQPRFACCAYASFKAVCGWQIDISSIFWLKMPYL